MARWVRGTAGVLGVGWVAGALAVGAASRRWQGSTERLADELLRRAIAPPGRVSFPALDSLPAPVRRYFRTVLRDGQPYIRSARLAQTGPAYLIQERRARLLPIRVGRRNGTQVEVLGGVKAGDRVVLYPTDNVTNGVRVEER